MESGFEKITYAIITPARNEEACIEKTIQSMINQSVLPEKWVIVSDGSTDRTDEIVKKYVDDHPFIELIRMSEHRDRTFAAKVHCFNAGYKKLSNVEYRIVGNLDADISFEENYFEFLLDKFRSNHKLGVAGTPFVEGGTHYNYSFTNIEHVSGACQLFRRECFEEIGGYIPIKGGGIDWTAVTTARLMGWQTRTFTEKVCYHNKQMGIGSSNRFWITFKQGSKDYYLGGHPLWQLFRSCYQMTKKPYFINGLLNFFGYAWSFLCRHKRPISKELIMFHRDEQMNRLKSKLLFWRNKSV